MIKYFYKEVPNTALPFQVYEFNFSDAEDAHFFTETLVRAYRDKKEASDFCRDISKSTA